MTIKLNNNLMNTDKFNDEFWSYYLMLEDDLIKTFNFVSLHEDNYQCFSRMYLSLFLSICSEIDVLMKIYTKLFRRKKTENIREYGSIILINRIFIKHQVIKILNSNDIELKPWVEWNTNPDGSNKANDPLNISPTWWKDYQKVKHNRVNADNNESNIKFANQRNVLYSLAALFIIEMSLYKEFADIQHETSILQPVHQSKLFRMKNWVPYTDIIYGNLTLIDELDRGYLN